MTTHDWIMLGKRAVACKGWRWMPGMRAIEGVLREGHSKVWQRAIDGVHGLEWSQAHGGCWDPVPDLRDPATLGCLLALVRESHPGCAIWVARDCVVNPLDDTEHMLDEREGWTVCGGSGDDYLSPYGRGSTEAEALVGALEAAND